MTARLAPSFAPPNAIRMWTDGRYIFAELPAQPSAAPCILSFRVCEGGLSKALSLLCSHADYSGSPVLPSRRAKDFIGTPSQHALAQSLLAKHGIK